MCGQFFEKMIVACSVGASHVSYLAVSTVTGVLVHECAQFSKCFGAVIGTATHWHLQNSLKLYPLHSA